MKKEKLTERDDFNNKEERREFHRFLKSVCRETKELPSAIFSCSVLSPSMAEFTINEEVSVLFINGEALSAVNNKTLVAINRLPRTPGEDMLMQDFLSKKGVLKTSRLDVSLNLIEERIALAILCKFEGK